MRRKEALWSNPVRTRREKIYVSAFNKCSVSLCMYVHVIRMPKSFKPKTKKEKGKRYQRVSARHLQFTSQESLFTLTSAERETDYLVSGSTRPRPFDDRCQKLNVRVISIARFRPGFVFMGGGDTTTFY